MPRELRSLCGFLAATTAINMYDIRSLGVLGLSLIAAIRPDLAADCADLHDDYRYSLELHIIYREHMNDVHARWHQQLLCLVAIINMCA
jgi:hypothetical protein